jgi:hypothetical protein
MLLYRCDKDGKLHPTIYAEGDAWLCEQHITIETREKVNAAVSELKSFKQEQKKSLLNKRSMLNE